MMKIGRNAPCACGSGKKYKKCCYPREREERIPQDPDPLEGGADGEGVVHAAVNRIKRAALAKEQQVWTSGVLVLFSTDEGDSWLLEVTENDALQLTDRGGEIEVVIEENPETTLVEWSHTFAIQKDEFVVTSYMDKASEQSFIGYPIKKISRAIEEVKKRMPAGLAGMVHVSLDSRDEAADSAGG